MENEFDYYPRTIEERDYALNAFRQYKNALNNYFKTLETVKSGFEFRT